MTTNPARSKWRTTRSAAMAAMYSAASCFGLRPSNRSAKPIDSARSSGEASVSLSSGICGRIVDRVEHNKNLEKGRR
jgi:hypothetical protein